MSLPADLRLKIYELYFSSVELDPSGARTFRIIDIIRPLSPLINAGALITKEPTLIYKKELEACLRVERQQYGMMMSARDGCTPWRSEVPLVQTSAALGESSLAFTKLLVRVGSASAHPENLTSQDDICDTTRLLSG